MTALEKEKQENKMFLKYLIVACLFFILWAVLQIVDLQADDRESYMNETMEEVGKTWSSDQILGGPVIFYDKITYEGKPDKTKENNGLKEVVTKCRLEPEELSVKCDIDSKKLHRAIYDVSVYSTKAEFSGYFKIPQVLFDPSVKNIRIRMTVSDLKGIYEQVNLYLDSVKYQLNPDINLSSSKNSDEFDEYVEDALSTYLSSNDKKKKSRKLKTEVLESPVNLAKGKAEIPFKVDLAIKGSNSLGFYPVGNATTVEAKSSYNNPSFKGDFLPIDRTVDENGFSAVWKVLQINRANPYSVSFGVDLIQPVTQYQMTSRSIKYGVFVILLVFLAAIIVELFTKRKINALQYAVVGLSLVLFYLLLLSFSDFLSFGKAYLIASLMTTLALTAYFKGILKHKSAYLLGILTFIFLMCSYVMMQMQVYSLLTGSLILFVILCVIMYLTKNMSSNPNPEKKTETTNK